MEFLPQLAADIATWFPEMEGRVLAVADAHITKDNLPKLPLVMVSLASAAPDKPVNLSQRSLFTNDDRFVIEFWLKSERYVKENNGETPFWTYYNYQNLRDKLFTMLKGYQGSDGARIMYTGMGVDASEYAVLVTFNMIAHYEWCPSPEIVAECESAKEQLATTGIIDPSTWKFSMCRPRIIYCHDADAPECRCPGCQDRLDAAAQHNKDSIPGDKP